MRSSLLVALVLGVAVSAAPASATPTADFTYKPLLPQLGEPVSLWAGGSVCDARPCSYVWSAFDEEGEATVLGAGRSLVVRFDAAGLRLIQLKVTNRGYRAPPGPTWDAEYRLLFVLPFGLPQNPDDPEASVDDPATDHPATDGPATDEPATDPLLSTP